MRNGKTVMVVDAQGGGLGRQLVGGIRRELPGARILAIGATSSATAAMLKAGADEAATGENAVRVAARRADVIAGPVGMVIADAMLGEITPGIALAIAQADAKRVMVPFNTCDNYIAGVADFSAGRLIADAVAQVRAFLTNET